MVRQFFKNTSIHRRVLLLCLLPLTLTTVILTGFFIYDRLNHVHLHTHELGQSAVTMLVSSSEYGILSGNTQYLASIAEKVLKNENIVHINILDAQKNSIYFATGSGESHAYPWLYNQLYLLFNSEQTNTYEAPVIFRGINIDDYNIGLFDHQKATPIGWVNIAISKKFTLYQLTHDILQAVTLAIVVYLIFLFFLMRFTRDLGRGIRSIKATVEKIQDGHLQARAEVDIDGEVGALAKGINQMADTLQRSDSQLRGEVEQATTNLRSSYAEIEKQNEELQAARAQAESANATKSEFLASISHEIRTPINGIMGFIDILMKGDLTPQQREYARTIQYSSRNLTHLINDLLDIARIESGKMSIEAIPFELKSIMENIYSMYSSQAFEKGLNFYIHIENDLKCKLLCDPLRIEQIFTNLVTNAIKFTSKGYISIQLRTSLNDNNQVKIEGIVEDTGIGLDKNKLNHIFQQYEQADVSTTRKYGGSGLGLAITKKIIDLFNGDIKVSSSKGIGSRFEFHIMADYTRISRNTHPIDNLSHIFYCDDDPQSRRMFVEVFRDIHFKVTTLDDLSQLPTTINQRSVLIYSVGPEHTVLDHLKEPLRKVSRTLPTIALVSTNNPEAHKAYYRLGFDSVLTKSISPPQLSSIISSTELLPRYTREPTAPLRLKPKALTAVIVDDNEINLKMLKAYLENLQVTVHTAQNSEQAVTAVERHEPDIVFMDLHMPLIDGCATTIKIRSLPQFSQHLPIIGVTADSTNDALQRAKYAGMNTCLIKPVSFEAIESILKQFTQEYIQPDSVAQAEAGIEEPADDHLNNMLLQQLPDFKAQLQQALSENDTDQIFQIAHKMSGGLAYVNQPRLRDEALKLQDAAKQHDVTETEKFCYFVISTIDAMLGEQRRIHRQKSRKPGAQATNISEAIYKKANLH